MVKGKYVAMVEVDFAFDENGNGFKPFNEMRDGVQHEMTPQIQEILAKELKGLGKVTVNQMYADLYQAKIEK